MIEKIKKILAGEIDVEVVKNIVENSSPVMLEINTANLVQVCQVLHHHKELYFDFLQCISGVDNGVEAGTMEVIYHLHSIPYNYFLALQITLNRPGADQLVFVPSISHIWRTADWLERETYDLMGIQFTGHPDPRRILLPADWKGHPLRKDYQVQDYYHGIKVD